MGLQAMGHDPWPVCPHFCEWLCFCLLCPFACLFQQMRAPTPAAADAWRRALHAAVAALHLHHDPHASNSFSSFPSSPSSSAAAAAVASSSSQRLRQGSVATNAVAAAAYAAANGTTGTTGKTAAAVAVAAAWHGSAVAGGEFGAAGEILDQCPTHECPTASAATLATSFIGVLAKAFSPDLASTAAAAPLAASSAPALVARAASAASAVAGTAAAAAAQATRTAAAAASAMAEVVEVVCPNTSETFVVKTSRGFTWHVVSVKHQHCPACLPCSYLPLSTSRMCCVE